ncbi:MAG: hypothetical protein LIO94_09350 [Clostridiales bacterium]|nr:hypothetical protein [Clostridiales bacterium]
MEETQHRFNLTYIDEDGNEEPVPGYMHGDSLPIENHRADSSDEGSIEEERLECLTEKQREAWKLKQQGLTYNEIAAELNISYVGARNHVIHAEQKLQKYDSQAEMEKGRGESAGVLWTAKPPEQEIGVTGNTNYPVEQPLSRADALLMLKLVGDYIKTCEYVTPHNAKKEWVSRMPYMYGYAMNLEKKHQQAVYGEIQYPPNRDYEKQIKECEPAETVDDEGELDGMKEAE